MVDIHSHALYGLDDGARVIEESLDMIRMAAEHGTTDLVCTPHADPTYKFDPAAIRERLDELRDRSASALRLYSGCDFHLSYDNIQDAIANPRKYTIAQQNYLLVEFSNMVIFHTTTEIFARLQDAGMIPVITHPERNPLLRQRIDNIAAWVESGVRVQVTAQSLLGEFGKRARGFCESLLDRDLVHFVASDAHDCQRRPPRLDLAREWLQRERGARIAQALCVENPRKTLTGEILDLAEPEVNAPTRKWYQIWRRDPATSPKSD